MADDARCRPGATVIEAVEAHEIEDALVAQVRVRRAGRCRCGRCGRRAPGYYQGEGRRRWRALDLGALRCYLEADSPRVNCPDHGPTVAQVPWGVVHGRVTPTPSTTRSCGRHSYRQEHRGRAHAGWVVNCRGDRRTRRLTRRAAACVLWTTSDASASTRSPQQQGHRYLLVVVDHDTGRLVHAAVGANKKTLGEFFDLLGDERSAEIVLVSADAAPWIGEVVKDRCVNSTLCIDGFHVVKWATDALDEVRQVWNEARKSGMKTHASDLKGARYALWKNPEDLTDVNRPSLCGSHRRTPSSNRLSPKRAAPGNHQSEGYGRSRCSTPGSPGLRDVAFVLFRRCWPLDQEQSQGHRSRGHNNSSNALIESTNTKIRRP